MLSCLDNSGAPRHNGHVLDPLAPVPLYRQLAEELLAAVHSGALREGARIPSEHELARQHQVGRPTVRQATEILVRQGILQRHRGSGTFVKKPAPPVDLFTLSGTLAAFQGSGAARKSKVVERPRVREVHGDSDHPFSGARAITLSRLVKVDRVPVLLEQLFLDPDLFAGVERDAVADGSLSRWLERTRGERASGGRQTFRVEPIGGKSAALLDVREGTPLLVVLRTVDFSQRTAGLYARMICRTDQVQLTQTLRVDGSVSPEFRGYGDRH